MRKNKFLCAVFAVLTAMMMLAVNSSAYIHVVSSPSPYLDNDESEWMLQLDGNSKEYIRGITKVEMKISINGNADLYYEELNNGAPNGDFTGFLGIGAAVEGPEVTNQYWQQYDFKSFLDTNGDAHHAAVKKIGDATYLLTADLTGISVTPSQSDATITLKDWGNFSPDYSIAVDEVSVYGPDGNVVFHSDASGTLTFYGQGSAETTAAETEAETTVETTEETTVETTVETASEETTAETTTAETTTTTAATTTAATTTAEITTSEETAAATTKAAETTAGAAAATNTTGPSNGNFGSRDSSLLIVGIVAGVIIIGLVVAIILVMKKKKKDRKEQIWK